MIRAGHAFAEVTSTSQSYPQVTFTLIYLTGYFKEFNRAFKKSGMNTGEPITVRDKFENLDDKIDVGLHLCQLKRSLDEIGTLTAVFFW